MIDPSAIVDLGKFVLKNFGVDIAMKIINNIGNSDDNNQSTNRSEATNNLADAITNRLSEAERKKLIDDIVNRDAHSNYQSSNTLADAITNRLSETERKNLINAISNRNNQSNYPPPDPTTKGLYLITDLGPQRDKVINLISKATGLANQHIHDKIKYRYLTSIIIGRPACYSKNFINDLEYAGATIEWNTTELNEANKPSLLYDGELNLPK